MLEVEFLIKEPMSSLIEGMTVSTDSDFSRVDAWFVRIVGVELSDITSRVDCTSVSMLCRHFLPPVRTTLLLAFTERLPNKATLVPSERKPRSLKSRSRIRKNEKLTFRAFRKMRNLRHWSGDLLASTLLRSYSICEVERRDKHVSLSGRHSGPIYDT